MPGRWTNPSLPDTLQGAIILLYIDAVFGLLLGAAWLPFLLAQVAAGYGIANEKKWGYLLGVVVAVLGLLPYLYALIDGGRIFSIIGFFFAGLLVYLLLAPRSREHQRIWFR